MMFPSERIYVDIGAVGKKMLLILNIISITANLACDIPEANLHITSIVKDPIRNARHAGTAPGLKKFEKLHSDKIQTAKCSHKPALDEVASIPHLRMGPFTL